MAAVIFILVFSLMFGLPIIKAVTKARLASNTVQAFDQLEESGIPARGLVLSSSIYVTNVTINQRRFERRTMTLDVQIPGRQAYESSGVFLVPRGRTEAIPGSSLELSVDPGNPDKIAVLGPGGFTGPWLNLGPPQPY